MLVETVNEFVNALSSSDLECDRRLSSPLNEHFVNKKADSEISADDRSVLLGFFAKRWALLIDSKDDYTCNPGSSINQLWIDFAKKLALELENRSWVRVLLPTITNTVDYNEKGFALCNVAIENIIVGDDDRTLYTKSGIYKQIKKNNSKLLTHKECDTPRTIRVLTVKELSRLKLSSASFSTRENTFNSFWECLQQKIFPSLNPSNELPLNILPHFYLLIKNYFALKTAAANFSVWREELERFFSVLYTYEQDEVNQFYGVRIDSDESNRYVLDFLLQLHGARAYELDRDLLILARWLSQVNRSFDITILPLIRQYSSGAMSIDGTNFTEKELQEQQSMQCKIMLLALFTNSSGTASSGSTISLLDKQSIVHSDDAEIFEEIAASIKTNDLSQLAFIYRRVVDRVILFDLFINTTFSV